MEKVKYNLGSARQRLKGFTTVDALDWDGNTDIFWNLTKTPYEFVKEPVDEILAMEVLEHISFRDTDRVLAEWYRILKPGGKIHIQVPDCGKMMEMYVKKQVCQCVPHKAKDWDSYHADPKCWDCKGKAKVAPTRWLFSFTGAQKHQFDKHLSIFTKESLETKLRQAGFSKIEFKPNIYKLTVTCFK